MSQHLEDFYANRHPNSYVILFWRTVQSGELQPRHKMFSLRIFPTRFRTFRAHTNLHMTKYANSYCLIATKLHVLMRRNSYCLIVTNSYASMHTNSYMLEYEFVSFISNEFVC